MQRASPSEPELIFISIAARMLEMHPQTLRKYERLGLVQPSRTIGSMRLYSPAQIERLRFIKHLVEEEGVNLAGVQRLLAIAESFARLRPQINEQAFVNEGARRRLAREMDQLASLVGVSGV